MKKQFENLLKKGVSRIIDEKSLTKRLESGKTLRIKFGIDPTAPIVHIGHAVPILKLREFQNLGHEIIILIGDATAQVGDSSDKDAERPMLKREETRANAEKYLSLFGKILDLKKVEVYYNSEGLDAVNFCGVGELAKNFSVAEMLDRDNFSKRFKSGVRISLQEFLYPMMQGYDSVAIARKYGSCDVELGGNDQYFNLLAGRALMEAHGMEKQDILITPLIMGTDGEKMSKTKGNYISLDMLANNMFVKIMEIPDSQIIPYFESCTTCEIEEIAQVKKDLEKGIHPREIKKKLAREVVGLYHDADSVNHAEEYFESTIAGGARPADEDITLYEHPAGEYPIVTLIREIGMVGNSTEARNALSSNGVKVDEVIVTDPKMMIQVNNQKKLIQVGKKKFGYIVEKDLKS
ncbi:tyrosine--tRNA ligase [Candidatus Gracilibacteria bacterium]|nr:tyrosine--tRNA ligase [Candidatus Gracilibacteria bacterium]